MTERINNKLPLSFFAFEKKDRFFHKQTILTWCVIANNSYLSIIMYLSTIAELKLSNYQANQPLEPLWQAIAIDI